MFGVIVLVIVFRHFVGHHTSHSYGSRIAQQGQVEVGFALNAQVTGFIASHDKVGTGLIVKHTALGTDNLSTHQNTIARKGHHTCHGFTILIVQLRQLVFAMAESHIGIQSSHGIAIEALAQRDTQGILYLQQTVTVVRLLDRRNEVVSMVGAYRIILLGKCLAVFVE